MDRADVEIAFEGTTTRFLLPDRASDHIQRHIFEKRSFYELDMLRHAATLIEPGQLAVDVGACIGNHTLFFANVCGARVVAFEPNPAAFFVLQQNVALGGFGDRVRLERCGLGRVGGHAELATVAAGNLGNTTLRLVDDGSVPVIALDEVDLPGAPRIIKIDVEGMEVDVLRGAEHTIREHRPLLYVETETKAHLARVMAVLQPWGYGAVAQFNATATVLFAPDAAPGEQLAYALHSIGSDFGRQGHRIDAARAGVADLAARQQALAEKVEGLERRLHSVQELEDRALVALARIEGELGSLRKLIRNRTFGFLPKMRKLLRIGVD